MDAPGCHELAARAERKSALQRLGQARIGQNCRAVCTKKSGLNASGHSYSETHCLTNDLRESAARFERTAKQALALATEPRAKREERSVLCHTCQ